MILHSSLFILHLKMLIMKKIVYILLSVLVFSACSSSDDDTKDMEYPKIVESEDPNQCNPIPCQVYNRGDVIPFRYVFTDNAELGRYNIEIHNNFDHHTHGTSSVDCPLDDKKTPVKPWVYNQDYTIPSGQTSFEAKTDITIPKDIDPGDYHFMIRVTDKAGWQQLAAISIKIK